MIKKEVKDGIVHTFSDEGYKIRRKGTDFPVNNAYEPLGKEHEWEEVIPEPAEQPVEEPAEQEQTEE